MPNFAQLAVCPYYVYENEKSISCEDTYRRFETAEDKTNWMEQYCCTWSYSQCPYAAALDAMYERIDGGADVERTELEQQVKAMTKELKAKATLLGKAEKRIERQQKKIDELRAVNQSLIRTNQEIDNRARKLYRERRELIEKLEGNDEKVQAQINAIAEIYEARMCYMIDKLGGSVLEDDIKAWAEGKYLAIAGDYEEEAQGIVWRSLVRTAEEMEAEEAETDAETDEVSQP